MHGDNKIKRPAPSSRSVESESDDEFFDADNGPEPMVTSPSVSVPLIDEDPSDVEEDQELHEDNDTSSESQHQTGWGIHVRYPPHGCQYVPPHTGLPVCYPPHCLLPPHMVTSTPHIGGVAQNKSVIMHMLSQVRIGMDLSKIVLPTFILEKRSLLEMWAELFSHADYFSE